MRVLDLASDRFAALLGSSGARIRTGPFSLRLRSRYRSVAETVHFLYADFPVDEAASFADLQVEIRPAGGLRRWLRPQALFHLDGEPLFQPYPGRLAVPLLEWGLNWCVATLAHQYLILHAAVLERDGLAVVMPAKPGSGKSTLCAALAHRGWRLLSDEMALLRPEDGFACPWPRPIGLKNGSIELLRRFAPHAAIGPVWRDTKKGDVAHMRPPRESVERATEPARPAWLVFPQWRDGSAARFEATPKADAMIRAADNSMNYRGLGGTGFETLADLVDRCDCLDFEYGRLDDAIAAFEELARP